MGDSVNLPRLTVVVPLLNEEAVLDAFHAALTDVAAGLPAALEVIYVDDGSTDGTSARLESLRARDPRVKTIEFSRNFGHQSALAAGLARAGGDAVVLMDGDLQDPPSLLPAMLERWRNGAEVVYAVHRSRAGESFVKRATAHLFYRFLRRAAGTALPLDAGDFRLLDRRVVDALNALPERRRYLRGLVGWVGFRQEALPFDRPARAAGKTKFTFFRMLRFALDGVTSFTSFPLRLVTLAGGTASLGSLVLLGWAFYVKFVAQRTVPGWTSLMAVVLFMGGAQFLALGVVGEYLARVLDEAKGRPLYVVRRVAGFEAGDPPPK